MKVPITIIVHTLNEAVNLPHTLENVMYWADQVCVVDSESTDGTGDVARAAGAELFVRACNREGLVAQRNWALSNINFRNPWVFILDADEIMEDALKAEVEKLVSTNAPEIDGYWCRFKLHFMGRWIKHSSMYPSWSLRLFRHQCVRYEKREVNSHPLVPAARAGYLREHIVNNDRRGFAYYLKRLDEFSMLEARAYENRLAGAKQQDLLSGQLFGSRAERRRYLKNLFIRLPFKPILIFIYLYFVRLGFLDGKPGLHYSVFKAVAEWAIVVKRIEMRETQE